MKSVRILGAVALAVVVACGGGGDTGDGDGGPGGVDAGTPDAGVATGFTARGGYAGAVAHARAEHDDATLFEVAGKQVDGNGEVNPEVLQSTWSFRFVSPSMGVGVSVLFYQDMYALSTSDLNPEGLLLLGKDWPDSDIIMDKLAAAGFTPPTAAEPYTTVAMTLRPEELLQDVPDPHWEIEKITAEPGQEVQSERWFALFYTAMNMYVVCPPMDDCGFVP